MCIVVLVFMLTSLIAANKNELATVSLLAHFRYLFRCTIGPCWCFATASKQWQIWGPKVTAEMVQPTRHGSKLELPKCLLYQTDPDLIILVPGSSGQFGCTAVSTSDGALARGALSHHETGSRTIGL